MASHRKPPVPPAGPLDPSSTADGVNADESDAGGMNPAMHLVAPLVAIGATFVVRKVMDASYRSVTGKEVPAPRDPSTSWGRALAWAMVTAAVAAAVEVAVYRAAAGSGRRRSS